MHIKKSIQLTTAPLEELIAKGESIDFRLDEAAWQNLKVGDYVEFWEDFTGWQKEPTNESRRVIVRIEHIYKAPSFQELFSIIEQDMDRLGDKDELLQGLRSWWSEDKENTEGVLAFHVVVV
jgi:ASC-1-like (ASCH) protein